MDVSSVGIANLATMMSGVKTEQAHATAINRLAKDQIQQAGQQVLQLIDAAGQPPNGGGSVGSTVDVKA